ncbi:MAG: RluA family pseudouridine synthase [Alicyclobacillus sp.]|nr:RluA family pseudouridine synthase [Alicyclobacillus sp.]
MEAGKKVHRWLRQVLPGVPLSGIHKMIRTGRVKRNGKRAKADDVLVEGDRMGLVMAEADFEQVSRPVRKYRGVPTDVEIVYEDDDLLVVNKPAGLLTHGAAGEFKDTLANRVAAHLYARGELDGARFVPSPAHRLDRNTSGLVLFAKSAETARRVADALKDHRIRKWYLAIVRGVVPVEGVVDTPLSRDAGANRTLVEARGEAVKEAVTRYRRLAESGRTSVVQIELVTGRTHQIRAHFSHLGHPLWGDVKYGGARPLTRPASSGRGDVEGDAARRDRVRSMAGTGTEPHQWLHAAWLRLEDGRMIHAPLPEAFRRTLRRLGYSQEAVRRVDETPPVSD